MAGFQSNAFQSPGFQSAEVVTLHGGTKQRRVVGRRDLDKLEREAEERRVAALRAVEAAQEAARVVEVAEREKAPRQTILGLQAELDATQHEAHRQAIRLQAQKTARAAADAAEAYAIAVQRQLDAEAAEAFMAYLMAA